MRVLLTPLLLFYPYTISLSTSEAEPGQAVTATISAPAGAAVAIDAPGWIAVGPIRYLGGGSETYTATLRVADDAPMSRVPIAVRLLIDGRVVGEAALRVHTERVLPLKPIYLPMVEK